MQELVVTGVVTPMRLDRYLRTLDPSMTQGFIEKALRSNNIKLLSKKAKASDRVNNGDIITFTTHAPIIVKLEAVQVFCSASIALAQKLLKQYLIYEHNDFIAINKPANLATQGGTNISLSIDHALKYLNTQGYDFRLVHRLDKETTGVLLIAKNRHTATLLGESFKQHLILKKYIAILCGKIAKDKGHIESYLAKRHDKVYEAREDDVDAKLAITDYVVMKKNGNLSLVEFTPSTGRMHQIRCHAALFLKAPILGDNKYGYEDPEPLCLHASEIIIPKEVFGVEHIISVTAPNKYVKLMQ